MFSHHWPILLWVWNLYQAYFSLINCLCNISLLFQVVVGPCKSGCFLCIGMTLAILRIERNCPVEKDIKDRVFQISLRCGIFSPPPPPSKKKGGGDEEFYCRKIFYWVVRIWVGVILTIQTFSKLKTTCCRYWILIKIKISMTCVYKEHEVKIKMVQEQWLLLKMKFLIGLQHENCFLPGWGVVGWGGVGQGVKFLWEVLKIWWGVDFGVEVFQVGEKSKFLASGVETPPLPQCPQ